MDYSLVPFLFVLVVSFVIGCIFSKSAKENSGYFLANRSLKWPLLTMTFVATQIGGGFILGTADAAYQDGPFALAFPLGYCLGFLALGLGFGAKLRGLELNTASDVFERYYGSIGLKKTSSILSIISLTGILIAQAVALKKFLISAGWGDEWIFLLAWSVVILYTTQGGFLAVVWTDTVQAVVMVGMLLVAFFFTMDQAPIIPSFALENSDKWQIASPKLLGYLLMPFLFTFIEQDMAQRCFAANSRRDVTIAGLFSALILLALAIIPVYFGMMADSLHVIEAPNSKFMEVVKLLTNKTVTSCASSAVLLAIISTASSLLSAVSSNLAQDFTTRSKTAIKSSLSRTKAITLATGVIALISSYTATNILSWMIASYELSVACLFVPYVAAVLWKERCEGLLPAAITAVLAGGMGFLITKLSTLGMWGDLLPLACSATGYGIAFLIIRGRKTRSIQEMAAG